MTEIISNTMRDLDTEEFISFMRYYNELLVRCEARTGHKANETALIRYLIRALQWTLIDRMIKKLTKKLSDEQDYEARDYAISIYAEIQSERACGAYDDINDMKELRCALYPFMSQQYESMVRNICYAISLTDATGKRKLLSDRQELEKNWRDLRKILLADGEER